MKRTFVTCLLLSLAANWMLELFIVPQMGWLAGWFFALAVTALVLYLYLLLPRDAPMAGTPGEAFHLSLEPPGSDADGGVRRGSVGASVDCPGGGPGGGCPAAGPEACPVSPLRKAPALLRGYGPVPRLRDQAPPVTAR